MELVESLTRFLRDVMCIKHGEDVVITVDSLGDFQVARSAVDAALAMGAHPTLLMYPSQSEAHEEPPQAVAAAIKSADVWVEFAVQYILYTQARQEATKHGCRYACLSGMDAEMCVRTIGHVDQSKVMMMGDVLVRLFKEAQEIVVTSEKGTHVVAQMSGEAHQSGKIAADPGDVVMLSGQACHLPIVESIQGTIVVDGVIWPPSEIGILHGRVELRIISGKIVRVDGGEEAALYRRWLASHDDPELYKMAHYCYGFNPGGQTPSGRIIEDERVFGALTFGFGSTPEVNAASHTDCVVLKPSVTLDGVALLEDGVFVPPELNAICTELKAPGY